MLDYRHIVSVNSSSVVASWLSMDGKKSGVFRMSVRESDNASMNVNQMFGIRMSVALIGLASD